MMRDILLAFLAIFVAQAETVKDRQGAVLEDRARMEGDANWIYNDWQRGFAEAKRTGKPLMVVLRCVPCLACMGIDASVLSDPDLRPQLEKFVRVRVMNANALDLSLFQFDYDLSFSTMFFNADGTVYGRYGSWTHQKNSQDKTTAGYKRALEEVLAIHAGYPGNKEFLKGKQGRAAVVKDPLQLPELAGKYKRELDWEGKVVQSCVHCHQIGEGVRSFYRERKEAIPRPWIYPMPAAETIGLTLAPDAAARVLAVAPESVASRAGFVSGDDILSLGEQRLVSIADFSWALNQAPEAGKIAARVKRNGGEKELQVTLPPDWRLQSDISGRVGTWGMRAMALGGLSLVPLDGEERKERGLPANGMALLVRHAGEYGNHAAAKKAGFRKDDVLTSVGPYERPMTESELIGRLLENYSPGEKVPSVVRRGSETLRLDLPIQ